MSIPFGTDIVTLIQRVESVDRDTGRTRVSFRSEPLTGCSWRHTERWTRYNETKERGASITCRIPSNQTRPSPGDYLILGSAEIDLTDAQTIARAMERYRETGAIIVTAVKDNARPGSPLPHWAATGE